MSTPTPRFCTVTLPDGTTCSEPYHAKDKCYWHYHDAYNASRRKPGTKSPRVFGPDPVQYAFRVPRELGERVAAAVKASPLTLAAWLEAAIRAQLERERRAPPPPDKLVGALQDRCHEDSGPVRPGRSG